MSVTAIYGGGPFYTLTDTVINDIINSGYNTFVFWTMHVRTDGTITHNGPALVQKNEQGVSEYVGDPAWIGKLAKIKDAGLRILFSIGSAPYPQGAVWDFQHIAQNMTTSSQGGIEVFDVPTSGNVLFDNFKALLDAFVYTDKQGKSIQLIDGLVFDNEDYYSQSTMITFSRMLKSIGFGSIAFCPYTQKEIWSDTLYYLENGNSEAMKAAGDASGNGLASGVALPGFVTEYQLQCYDGGGLNNIYAWASQMASKMGWTQEQAEEFIYPGYWVNTADGATASCKSIVCPNDVQMAFAGFLTNSAKLKGGFIWYYDQIEHCQSSSTQSCNPTPNATNYCLYMEYGLGLKTPPTS
ncbi:MAG: hypothetical protein Roseis2KO_35280 [Roseivirga sp.]